MFFRCSIYSIGLLISVFLWTVSAGAQEIKGPIVDAYGAVAKQLIEAGHKSNDSMRKLEELCDGIGHRLSGSASLDRAIEWAQATMKADGQENVRAEKVMVTKWVRGKESCELVEPRSEPISMLGLGGSIGTPAEGLTAEVIVVGSKEELDALPAEKVAGRIVVFNAAMPKYTAENGSGYGTAVQYRGSGAKWAAEKGAVAALVRSVTATSLSTPHTGAMRYGDAKQQIPVAAITIETAMMLQRLQDRGVTSKVKLSMEARTEGEAPSANVLAEIVGREKPEEIVVIGGHIDSWDVGQGAHDDGAGCVAAMEALNMLRKLGLQPRRTIRVVLWTNEENGLAGAKDYAARHQRELHVAGIEADSGGFAPEGFTVEMNDAKKADLALEQLQQIASLLKPIGATKAMLGGSGADVGQLKQLGTACLGLEIDGRTYFDFHHTWADTVDKVNPKELTDCAISLAVASFILADMPQRMGER